MRCLIFGILPSLVLIFFKNLPSFKIGAYRLVLIKDNACIQLLEYVHTSKEVAATKESNNEWGVL